MHKFHIVIDDYHVYFRFFILQKILSDVALSTEETTELHKVTADTTALLDTVATTVAKWKEDINAAATKVRGGNSVEDLQRSQTSACRCKAWG